MNQVSQEKERTQERGGWKGGAPRETNVGCNKERLWFRMNQVSQEKERTRERGGWNCGAPRETIGEKQCRKITTKNIMRNGALADFGNNISAQR